MASKPSRSAAMPAVSLIPRTDRARSRRGADEPDQVLHQVGRLDRRVMVTYSCESVPFNPSLPFQPITKAQRQVIASDVAIIAAGFGRIEKARCAACVAEGLRRQFLCVPGRRRLTRCVNCALLPYRLIPGAPLSVSGNSASHFIAAVVNNVCGPAASGSSCRHASSCVSRLSWVSKSPCRLSPSAASSSSKMHPTRIN